MLVLYLAGVALLLSILFYTYDSITTRRRDGPASPLVHERGRDMWVATLLDCEHEPAKVRFGPAKVIPADRVVSDVSHKRDFSKRMSHRK
ncbi:MAG: hypothetical protein ACTSV3_03955 [Candidatus Thorarchaeota archaeon]|nr:MAG: hypothetical protein DRO87_08110 [Candidatus Thorarchaeota archaeon]RLI57268.1 MAG: hypothetical protein DRP09_03225 [Candidatus Thorarchaeota archaeon]